MFIFPAIDLYRGQVVRLIKGDYNQMTVYSNDPIGVAKDFVKKGAKNIHIVDLDGARDGQMPNFDVIESIKKETGVFCEVGGGIRDKEAVEKYIKSGLDRVILGTAAIENDDFLKEIVQKYKDKIAVAVDILDNYVVIRGWQKRTNVNVFEFFEHLQECGVKYVICTDVSKDGLLKGVNRELYKKCSQVFDINIIASGGITNIEDIIYLKNEGLYGAVIGKAYYNKNIDLVRSIAIAEGKE